MIDQSHLQTRAQLTRTPLRQQNGRPWTRERDSSMLHNSKDRDDANAEQNRERVQAEQRVEGPMHGAMQLACTLGGAELVLLAISRSMQTWRLNVSMLTVFSDLSPAHSNEHNQTCKSILVSMPFSDVVDFLFASK
jgi:hypothetical protein